MAQPTPKARGSLLTPLFKQTPGKPRKQKGDAIQTTSKTFLKTATALGTSSVERAVRGDVIPKVRLVLRHPSYMHFRESQGSGGRRFKVQPVMLRSCTACEPPSGQGYQAPTPLIRTSVVSVYRASTRGIVSQAPSKVLQASLHRASIRWPSLHAHTDIVRDKYVIKNAINRVLRWVALCKDRMAEN